ncbi:MAG: hypothetical protein JNK82_21485 [Myxococcaceae bacterium]|nr:hypothetical protein [Myxococcaceae bacterium]
MSTDPREKLGKAAELTETKVREFPLAAVGLAFGAGVVLGAVGYALLRPEPTLRERIEDSEVSRKLTKLLGKYV